MSKVEEILDAIGSLTVLEDVPAGTVVKAP